MATLTEPLYAELMCQSHYSFLRGASSPQELIETAAQLGIQALALTDQNGVYGIPKAFLAERDHNKNHSTQIKLITGAQICLDASAPLASIRALATSKAGYSLLCRMLTITHCGMDPTFCSPQNLPTKTDQPMLPWTTLLSLLENPGAKDLYLIPDFKVPMTHFELSHYRYLNELSERITRPILVPWSRFLDGKDQSRADFSLKIASHFSAKVIATNQVLYHQSERQRLQDVLTCIRSKNTLKTAGYRLLPNSERFLRSPKQMQQLFSQHPQALTNTLEVADHCHFSPAELRYRYPSEWIPAGESSISYLKKIVSDGAKKRYPGGVPREVERQLDHELNLIGELNFCDYFLTIFEIVEFAKQRQILCQGRGSAANSVVCYCLGITAIDPIRMNLLFERFISAERGEPPDIDVDFEAERREEVIQHIYEKYGRERAAMVSAVITYRSRLAIREVSKVLECAPESPTSTCVSLADQIYGLPRHLSIHSGGFTLSADPMIETVPIEPARMERRTIVQWDKYDLDAVGLLKVDLLSLGMLSALKKTLTLIKKDLDEIPAEDPATYAMIQRGETVGTFQIESRAQISMLPRLLPKTFYDLVIQVAIVRPGPIQGKMVHPYLRRRRGLEKLEMPHPKLIPILHKTLGIPLFQEQIMKIAIDLGGFTPGEADQLRRAIGAWRSSGSIQKIGERLMVGLLKSGLSQDFVERIFEQIKGFAEYGFPESHAASFALLAYASAYLKCHHPSEFTASLINSQPMGFYATHTLLDEAKRNGVVVLPVDPNHSEWDCTLVKNQTRPERPQLRLGLRVIKGLQHTQAQALLRERAGGPFLSLAHFISRVRLAPELLSRMAMGNSFETFKINERDALWEILAWDVLTRPEPSGQLGLFQNYHSQDHRSNGGQDSLFSPLDSCQKIESDYQAYGLSPRGHPMEAIRQKVPSLPQKTTAEFKRTANPLRSESIAGLLIIRQRPPTAKGVVFATMEDQSGFLDLVIHADVYEKFAPVLSEHRLVIAKGRIQRDGGSISLIVKHLAPLWNSE